jgi:hypothetical protein
VASFRRASDYTLGLIDCGNPEIWLGLVKRWSKSEDDKQRMQQMVSALMADHVFALKFDEIVFNPYTVWDAGKAPIQYILEEFGKDFPAPVSGSEFVSELQRTRPLERSEPLSRCPFVICPERSKSFLGRFPARERPCQESVVLTIAAFSVLTPEFS